MLPRHSPPFLHCSFDDSYFWFVPSLEMPCPSTNSPSVFQLPFPIEWPNNFASGQVRPVHHSPLYHYEKGFVDARDEMFARDQYGHTDNMVAEGANRLSSSPWQHFHSVKFIKLHFSSSYLRWKPFSSQITVSCPFVQNFSLNQMKRSEKEQFEVRARSVGDDPLPTAGDSTGKGVKAQPTRVLPISTERIFYHRYCGFIVLNSNNAQRSYPSSIRSGSGALSSKATDRNTLDPLKTSSSKKKRLKN